MRRETVKCIQSRHNYWNAPSKRREGYWHRVWMKWFMRSFRHPTPPQPEKEDV